MHNACIRRKVDVKYKKRRIVSRSGAISLSVFRLKAAPSVADNLKRRVWRMKCRHPLMVKRVAGKSRANNCCSLNHKEYQTSIQASARHLQTNAKLMDELFESEDEEVSEVESFILEHGDLEEEPVLDTSKLLLAAEGADSPDLQTVDSETRAVLEAAGITFGEAHEVDPESRARLEALLDAAGLGKHIIDPEVLRRLTSSVSCALDEAAAALTRMRSEQQNGPTTSSSSSSLCNNSKQHQTPQQHAALDAVAAAVVDGSSLIDACNDGDLEAVRRLLDEGRNVNEVTEEGESLLSLACSSGYYELAQLLLATRANVEDRGLKDTTPLMEAASAGHVDIVKLLLTHGADVNAQTSQGNTPLMYACASGHEDVVKILLENGANVEDHNENGHTPLMEAASAGHVCVARMLVEHGASINTHSNEFKESALTLACYKGHLEMVRFLLEAGADQEHKTEEMHTALMEASMDGHVEVARLLLDSGAQVNMPADSFESPLTLAACGGHVELAMLLLERGANIEEVNDEGYTPLMEAAREGHEEMVALLLNQAADINAQTEETQETALTLACCGGFLEVADFLIKAGADIEAGANTPLMEAAQEGHIDLVRHLINCDANVNATTNSGDTALMYACENGHTDVAELLLKAGAALEHEAEGGRTPLMKAARAGHLCTVQFLVSKGANVNKMTTNNDHTPLSLACAGGHIMVVEFLLAHGADPTHRLKDNSTMLIEAAKGGHTTVVQLLIDYPNSSVKSPPPIDISQLTVGTTATDLCDNSAPRVPPHGVQANLDISEHHVSSSNQRKSSASSGGSIKHGVQKVTSRSKCNKASDLVEPYIPLPKGRSNTNKHLERSLSDSSASHLLNSVSTAGSASEVSTSSAATAAVGIDALKETERLEQCINNMMKRTEMLNPSREEQILQKQQILEELQRVERELQEKAQAQLLLTHQAQQQQQLIQSLCFQAGLSSTALSSTQTNSDPITTSAATEQEQQINNITSPSPAMLLLDMSTWKQPLKTGDCLNFQMQSSTPPTTDTSTIAQSMLTQSAIDPFSEVSTAAVSGTSEVTVSAVASPTNLSNISPNTSSGNRARSKQTTKVKNTVLKQQQSSLQSCSSQSIAEDVEKMNLRNVLNNEQQQQQPPSLPSGVDMSQTTQLQQQLILSELAQSFTNLRQAKPEALQFLQQTASHVKFDTPLPFLLPPFLDLNSFNQSVGLQPQHQQTQSTQTLISSLPDVFDSNLKKQIGLQSQISQQLSPQQQQTQSTQTSDIQNLENYTSSSKQLAAKLNKTIKVGTKGNQNQVSNQSQNSQITNAALVPSLTSQQLQVLKNQFAAAAAAASQQQPLNVDTSNINNLSQAIQLNSSTGLVIAGSTTSNTAYGTLVPTSGVFALGAPAFPVTLSLSPTSSTTSVTTSNTATLYQQPITLENAEGTASFLLKNHQRTLPDGAVGDFPLGTSASQTMTDNCFDAVNFSSNSSTMFANTVTSLPVGIDSIAFPQVPVSTSTTNQSKTSIANIATTVSNVTPSITPSSTALEQTALVQNSVKAPQTSSVSVSTVTTTGKPSSVPSPPPWYPPIDLDSQTDSNHDTALTLACAGGHEELVQLLLNRGANMEHRDKKGFTPLMLAATAGHANVCETLLSNNSDIEAQSERTKDTALSLACSSGRYEVVELLLSRGANKEHRNVSDYTPLSLAASGGYVNIIKLLLSHGAEINSRTGSKLGISPLMLAAMNGHAATVKLLLDMGSDINAQIETNRNTALTLACFQGRCEVVSLLLDRKANVEHRAKTGLTPLMEAASGGYVEVGRILLDKGADVNAPPVPSSRDTALTIAADKGHYRFVELLLQRGAQVDVKNKKGSSPLWLACNGGHLDVVQLLVNSGADIDSQDNRKVSCLMASFRKGHLKVVKWMVKHVTQFPSDQEMTRYLALINDKELMKKCNQCVDIIRQAKEKQAAEANKNATILLEEIDMERSREESRKLAAARRRERKRQKKKEKQEQLKAAKIAQESREKKGKCNDSKQQTQAQSRSDKKDDESDSDSDDEVDESNEEEELVSAIRQSPEKEPKRSESNKIQQTAKKKEVERNRKNQHPSQLIDTMQSQQSSHVTKKKDEIKQRSPNLAKTKSKQESEAINFNIFDSENSTNEKAVESGVSSLTPCSSVCVTVNTNLKTQRTTAGVDNLTSSLTKKESDSDCFAELSLEVSKETEKSINLRSPNAFTIKTGTNATSAGVSSAVVSKKVQKREEGWKEVVRRSKKVSVPANAISRVIGRAGCNINAVREISGAHIEVEKQKVQGDRQIIIKGSADATRHAQQLINGLVNEPEKDLSQIVSQLGLNRPSSCNGDELFCRPGPSKSSSATVITTSVSRVLNPPSSGIMKSASVTTVFSSSGISVPITTYTTRLTGAVPVRPTVAPANVAPPFANNNPVMNHAWGSSKSTLPPRLSTNANSQSSHLISTSPKTEGHSSSTKTSMYADNSYSVNTSSKTKTSTKSSQSNTVSSVKLVTNSDMKPNSAPFAASVRPQSQPFVSSSRVQNVSHLTNKSQNQTKPFGNTCVSLSQSNLGVSTATTVTTTTTSANTTPEYSPFNNLFSKVAQASVWGQNKESHKPNFASVAASGISSVAASQQVTSITSSLTIPLPSTSEPEVTVDASKAPGYRGNLHVSPSNASLSSTPSSSTGSNFGPIGSGPRSAPCTPPLLAMSSHSSNRQSTPPSSNMTPATPPPVNRSSVQENYQMSELNNVSNSSFPTHSVVSSSYQPCSSTNYVSCMSSQQLKSNAFNLAPGGTVARTYTNTTYSQHAPVSSVGQIHPPINGGNECLSTNALPSNSISVSALSGTVQSSLNPNAPDFSSRSSTSFSNSQPTQQSSGSNVRGAQHHTQPRSMAFQDVIPNPQLQMQMRAAILAAGASLQMQTLQAQAAQAQAIQNQARFQFGQNNFAPATHHHQQQQAAAAAAAAAAAMGTPDFTPPSAETLRLLHTAISAFPAANAALHASTPQNMQQFGLMQTAINIRQQQQQTQRVPPAATINVNNVQTQISKECESATTDNSEERKLPRPIGTERAQKKNPGYSVASNNQLGNASIDMMQGGIWPFGDVGAEAGDWFPPTATESVTNVLPNAFNARNYRLDEQPTDHIEHSFLANNAASAYGSVSATPVVNGLPPQMVAHQNILYHNTNVANVVANANSALQEAADYWTGKMPNVPGLGNGVSNQNTDHKLSWQTWNQHQA